MKHETIGLKVNDANGVLNVEVSLLPHSSAK